MSELESECRHIPKPVWNPVTCPKCGATLSQAEPVWTSERPTVPGWYWLRGSKGSHSAMYMWPDSYVPLNCAIAGPITPPPESEVTDTPPSRPGRPEHR